MKTLIFFIYILTLGFVYCGDDAGKINDPIGRQIVSSRAHLALLEAIEAKNASKTKEIAALLLWSNAKILRDFILIDSSASKEKEEAKTLLKDIEKILEKDDYKYLPSISSFQNEKCRPKTDRRGK